MEHLYNSLNSLNSRVLALEQEFKKLSVSFGGNTTFLKGEPGDISEATAAATKQMASELEKNREAIQKLGNELRAIHDQFTTESAQAQESFHATASGELQKAVNEALKDLTAKVGQMQDNLEQQAKALEQTQAEIREQQVEVHKEFLQAQQEFKTTVLGLLQQIFHDSGATMIFDLLVQANVIDEQSGKAHSSLHGRDGKDSTKVGPRGERGQAWFTSQHDEETAIQAIVDKAADAVIAKLKASGWIY